MASDVTLEPFTSVDISRLQGWLTSDDLMFLWSFHNFSFPLNEDEYYRHLEYANFVGSYRKIFKVVDGFYEETIGHIELDCVDYEAKSAILGRLIIGNHVNKRQGFGLKAMLKTMNYAFEDLGLHKLSLNVVDGNDAALLLYEKLGFVREGFIRDALVHESKYYAYYILSMLDNEWLEVKQKFSDFL